MKATGNEASAQPGATLVISEAAGVLRIGARTGERQTTTIYKLDGSEYVTPFGSGTAQTKLRWDGAKLVTETVYIIENAPVTVIETRSLNADGTEMTVDFFLRIEHGYGGVSRPSESGSPNASTTRDLYKKSR